MLDIPALPSAALDCIADEILELLPFALDAHTSLVGSVDVILDEALPVWRVVPEAVNCPVERLAAVAEPIERWHHQLRINGETIGFARSTSVEQPDDAALAGIFPGPGAVAIGATLDWLEASDFASCDERYSVRLLTTPVYQLLAVWLASRGDTMDYVVAADEPYDAFERFTAYEGMDFFSRLRELTPIEGIALGTRNEADRP